MEIGREQSSLVDVDNDLASLVQWLNIQADSLWCTLLGKCNFVRRNLCLRAGNVVNSPSVTNS